MSTDKLRRLQVYADGLRGRLKGPVPKKHDGSEESRKAFKQMIESDLKKTEMDIAKLQG